MDPFGAILGLAGAAASSGWQGQAAQMDWANLQFQKQQARDQKRMASATRSDAYGNKQGYDEILNEWITTLTPTQKSIVGAGEKEQLRSLTEDADRNRKIKVRAAKRGDEASKDYDKTLAEFRYDKPADEKSIRGELQQLLAGVSNSKARTGNADAVRQSLRSGGDGALPAILKATADDLGAALPENLLNARTMGMAESQGRDRAFNAKYIPELNQLATLMDQGGDMPLHFSDVPNRMAGEEGQQMQLLIQAMQNGAGNVNGANSMLSKTLNSGGPDLKALASMISGGTDPRSRQPQRRRTSNMALDPVLFNGDSLSNNSSVNWF